jgi:hypothetical protein
VAELVAKPVQDRFVTSALRAEASAPKETAMPEKSTKTAEALVPVGAAAAPAK